MAQFLYTIIIYPLYTIIECAFVFFNKMLPHVGYAIIGISVAVTLLCLPLYAVAEKWQGIERETQKKMKSQLDRIKQTFTGDERYMMTTAFYRENHYSPIMALRSSFGLLVQVPFFLAAYSFLSNLPSLKGTEFLFIKNLGEPDSLFQIGAFPINILPIAMTLINIVAGAIYTRGFSFKDKAQIYVMALVFLCVLYDSPAGLVLYWTMNNVFSLIKNIFYKLRNPLKSFWILCCTVLTLSAIYIFLYGNTMITNKIFFGIFVLIVFCLPFLLQFSTKILTKIEFLTKNNKLRFSCFFTACLILFVLSGIAIPSDLIGSSPVEFSDLGDTPNPLFFIVNCATQAFGFFVFWPICIYFLFSKKIQSAFVAIISAIAYIAIINTYIFTQSYGDISVALVFLSNADFKVISLISFVNLFVILFVFLSIPFVLHIKKGSVLNSISMVAVFSVVTLSASNIFSIGKSYNDYKSTYTKSESQNVEPIFEFSKTQPNVVLFMLDGGSAQFIPEIIKEDPNLKEIFSGFTFYNNTLSFNGHTLQGTPGLYGGYEYTPAEMNRRLETPLLDKHNEALTLLPRIFTEQANFSATIADPSWSNYQHFCDLSIIENYPQIKGVQTMGKYNALWEHTQPKGTVSDDTPKIIERNLLFFSFFRESPICFRKIIYKNGYYWNSNDDWDGNRLVIDSYAALYFLRDLTKITDKKTGSFMYMANELTHEQMFMQSPDFVPAKNVTDFGNSIFSNEKAYHTQMSAIKRIGQWIQFLKENGIYDNTRIVITSDHANGKDKFEVGFEKNDNLDKSISGGKYSGRSHYHCLLMYKDFNADGELKIDNDTFMTNADSASLLLKGLVENPINPYTKKTIPLDTQEIKKDGVFISASDAHQPPYNGKYSFSIKDNEWWHVRDNIFKSENWKQEKPNFQD